MPLSIVNAASGLSRRRRAELWVSGARSAQEIPGGESKANALAALFKFAGIPERGTDALKLLHEILVDQIDMLLRFQEQEDARIAAARVLNQYVDIYDFAPVAYLSLDSEGRVLTANLCAAALFEKPAGQLIGGHLRELLDPASGDALWAWAASLASHPGTERMEMEFWRDNRHRRRLQAEARMIEPFGTIALVLVDVTHGADTAARPDASSL